MSAWHSCPCSFAPLMCCTAYRLVIEGCTDFSSLICSSIAVFGQIWLMCLTEKLGLQWLEFKSWLCRPGSSKKSTTDHRRRHDFQWESTADSRLARWWWFGCSGGHCSGWSAWILLRPVFPRFSWGSVLQQVWSKKELEVINEAKKISLMICSVSTSNHPHQIKIWKPLHLQ